MENTYASYGIVFGESSINSIAGRPSVKNGIEQKFAYRLDMQNSESTKFMEIFQNSTAIEVEMEYLYHEGQTTINNKPTVLFDGQNITVNSLNTDILEDTFMWYVAKNFAGTGISISVQIFLTNCEYRSDGAGWPSPCEEVESIVKKLFSNDSVNKLAFLAKNEAILQKLNDFYTETNNSPINCATLSSLNAEIITLGDELVDAYNTWVDNETVALASQIPPDPCVTYAYPLMTAFNTKINSDLVNAILAEASLLAAEFDQYACETKVSLSYNFRDIPQWCGFPVYTGQWTNVEGTPGLGFYTKDSRDRRYGNFNLISNIQTTLGNTTAADISKDNYEKFWSLSNQLYIENLLILSLKAVTTYKLMGVVENFNPSINGLANVDMTSLISNLGC
jgi:hypothetical protein